MNKLFSIVLSVILILAIFVGGVWIGIGYQSQYQQNQETTEIGLLRRGYDSVVGGLSSSLISSIYAVGNIKEIEEQSITITLNDEILKFYTNNNTLIFKPGSNPSAGSDRVGIGELKTGQSIVAKLKINSDGNIMAESITLQ
jgi:hypothetical protein